ncbi:MAG: hypothetical protein ACPG21_07965 [Crocinitomicaceae bacterium]
MLVPSGIVCQIEKAVHLHEDIYLLRKRQVLYRLKSLLGLNENRLHGRKMTISEIDRESARDFLNTYHLMGDGGGEIFLGLYSTNQLVGLAAFSKPLFMRYEEPPFYSTELVRFCSLPNTTIVGGLDKITHYFFRHFDTDDIVTHVDFEWSTGRSFEKIGFELIERTKPLHFKLIEGKRILVKENERVPSEIQQVSNQGNLKYRIKRGV